MDDTRINMDNPLIPSQTIAVTNKFRYLRCATRASAAQKIPATQVSKFVCHKH